MDLIAPGVYRLTGLIAGNVYLISDPDGVTLINASIALSARHVLNQVRAVGRRVGDVRRVLVTNAHPDHVGALPRIVRETGAEVWASALERPVIEGRMRVPVAPPETLSPLARRFFGKPGPILPFVPVARELRDGEVLAEVMDGLHVVAAPGRTKGHLAFWHPKRRLLFCGDSIFHMNGLGLPMPFFTVDRDENIRSIRQLLDLNPQIACFGHGPPLMNNTMPKLQRFARKVGAL